MWTALVHFKRTRTCVHMTLVQLNVHKGASLGPSGAGQTFYLLPRPSVDRYYT